MERENTNKKEFCTRCGAVLNQGKCNNCDKQSEENIVQSDRMPAGEPIQEQFGSVQEQTSSLQEQNVSEGEETIQEQILPVVEEAVQEQTLPEEEEVVQEQVLPESEEVVQEQTFPKKEGAEGVQEQASPESDQNIEINEPTPGMNELKQENKNNNEYTHYDYSGQGYYQPQVPIEEPKKKMNTGIIIGIVVGASLFFAILIWCIWLSLFYVSSKNTPTPVPQKQEKEVKENQKENKIENKVDEEEDDTSDFDFYEFEKELREKYDTGSSKNDNEESNGYMESDQYYIGLQNSIDETLPYSVKFEEENLSQVGVNIQISYPVLQGEIPNLEYLNEQIYKEVEFMMDLYEEEKDGEEFLCEVIGYVTYTSEDVISIVFDEWLMSDQYYMTSLASINIDVKQGTMINNTEVLEVNDSFSIDFRNRETIQNAGDSLESYTDQELTQMLKDPILLILYYTPLGMEVGVNHDFGWATVTYTDYQKYLKSF